MRDLIEKYKRIIKGGNSSDTEEESHPILSSSESSTRSFGAVFKPSSETEQSDNEIRSELLKQSLSISPIMPNTPKHVSKKKTSKNYAIDMFPEPVNGVYYNNQILQDEKFNSKKYQHQQYAEIPLDVSAEEKNPSIVTIFAVWNTMLGSSLLAISWGYEKTGLVPGVIITWLLSGICCYTAYLLLKINQKHGVMGERCEVPDLCKMILGRWAEVLAKLFSLIVLIGANIVYWILMSNFLFHLVSSLYGFIYNDHPDDHNITVICPKQEALLNLNCSHSKESSEFGELFNKLWKLNSTVPVYLAFLIFPLLNFRDVKVFMRFNSLGTISVIYLIFFSIVKFITWGPTLPDLEMVFELKPTFVALTGMLSLSYFIHNIIVTMMKNNRHQENNGRDLSIAYGLVTFTYSVIGGLLYVAFPLAKICIEDNIFNNFDRYDMWALVGRGLLFFQLLTVFPLLTFMLRNDIFANISALRKYTEKFKLFPVMVLNFFLVVVCVLFACFLPRIGTIIRYIGAFSGLVYVFMLPNLLIIYSLKKDNQLSLFRLVFHVSLIVLGVINLLSQFLISDS